MPGPAASVSLGRLCAGADGPPVWYDTAQNALLAVDPVLGAALPLFGRDNDAELMARLAGELPGADVRRALAEIRRARADEGLFALAGPPAALADLDALVRDAQTKLSHLVLGLSERCNLRCLYCPQDHEAGNVMSEATARQAWAFFASHSVGASRRTVSFHGGEPLLHFPVVEAVARTARAAPGGRQVRLCLDTNATLLDEAKVRVIAELGLELQVSLDGPAHLHDRWRRDARGGPTHASVMAGLRRLLAVDPGAARRLRFVATVGPPFAFAEVAAWFDDFPLYRELGIGITPVVRLNTANLAGTRAAQRCEPRALPLLWLAGRNEARGQYAAAMAAGRRRDLPRALADLWDDGLVRWHHRRRGPEPGPGFPTGSCRPGLRRLFVAPDGTLRPCERVGPGQAIGDLDQGIDPSALRRLHEDLLAALGDRCRTCWARRLCRACFTALVATGGAAESCRAAQAQAADLLDLQVSLQQHHPDALAFVAGSRLE
ncbi:MAG: radical SAM protein [Krumholzibacteria bacterium]|nr:radical SAM protein [Candidatus Krumholzibacteria bacterium]